MDVGADEVFIGDIHSGGLDLAGNHKLRMFEEILVVGAAERAIGKDHRRLTASPGSPTALGIVGGCGRHVPHIHGIQVFDVDTEFHRGRAEQNGQPRIAEFPFTLDPDLGGNLGSMFVGTDPPELVNAHLVKINEKGVGGAAFSRCVRHANPVVVGHRPVTCPPDERTGVDAVPGHRGALSLGKAFTKDVSLAQSFE